MKPHIQIILLIVGILFGASVAIAQSGLPAKTNPPQNSKIKSIYEQSKDITIISIESILLSGIAADKLELEVFSFFRGTIPTEKPVAVSFFITSGSKKVLFDSFNDLSVVLDGEHIALGAMRRGHKSCEKTLPKGTGCVYWVEKMDLFIPYQSFLRIIQAKKVEGQIGARIFELKEGDLEMLRDFNKRIAPQGVQEF